MAGTVWPVLTAGTKAKASEVESKFDWIEGTLVPMNAGSKTNGAYDLGETANRWANLWVGSISTCTISQLTVTTTMTAFKLGTGSVSEITNTVTVADIAYKSAKTCYLSLPPSMFHVLGDANCITLTVGLVFNQSISHLKSQHATEQLNAACAVHLPEGAIVTAFKSYWYKNNDASATGTCVLRWCNFQTTNTNMASAPSNTNNGYHNNVTTTIVDPTITNSVRCYDVAVQLDPNDSGEDISFNGCVITYTIAEP